jgi:outer membrane protein OmpA-like peptidoglycan-associated protein
MIRKASMAIACSTLLVAGCANMTETQRGAAQGAGIGALGGAVLGGITDGRKGATRGAAIGGALGGAGGYVWSQRMEEQKRAMEQATQGTGIGVTQTADNQLRLEVPSDVSFAVNRADIQPNFRPVLDRFAQTLNQNPAATVRIIGHTDSTGSDAINDPLSVNRAASVRDYLAVRGVSPQRVQIDGRGAREPVASNQTDPGRAQNRRVEIFVGEAPVARSS